MKRGLVFTGLLMLLLPLFAIFPALSTPIEEHSYDAATFHVYRSVLFSAARAEGIFYPRWIQAINAGLGGPLFSFYSPLSYFALNALNAAGLAQPMAWRVLVSLMILAAFAGVFVLARALDIDAAGGLAASALFVYSFPFLRELFERGSPEGFALALYPWVLWSSVRLMRQPDGLRFGVAALGWAIVIWMHNLSALLLVPLFGVTALVLAYRHGGRAFGAAALAFGAGVLLSAFFTLPFIVERNFVHLANAFQVDYAQIARNAFDLRDLIALPPAYDLGLDNNFIGDHIGPLVSLSVLAGSVTSPLLWRRRARGQALIAAALTLFSLLVIWLQTSSANWVWETFTLLALVQIRTRLLGLVILSAALVCGIGLDMVTERWRPFAAYTLIAIAIFLALPVLYPQLQYRYAAFAPNPTPQDAVVFSMEHNVPGLTAFDEFLPIWRTAPFSANEAQRAAQSVVASAPADSRILRETRGDERADVEIESPAPFSIALLILYFPGWVGYVDGKPHALKPADSTGYIVMDDVPAGTHTLSLRYEGTAAQFVGAAISALTLGALLLIAMLWRGKGETSIDVNELPPHWWIVAGFVLLFGIKFFWLDPQTTWLRRASACGAIQDVGLNVQVRFGENMLLCGIDLPNRTLKPGDEVQVTVYWETTSVVREPTDAFVHLFGAAFNPRTNTPLWGQQDKEAPGYHSVTTWTPGKLYRDAYAFRVDPNAPAGEYKLEMGWWQPATERRLAPVIVTPAPTLSVSSIDSLLVSGITVQ
jgi:hypothetical protein